MCPHTESSAGLRLASLPGVAPLATAMRSRPYPAYDPLAPDTDRPSIKEICALRDPVLRNLWITQTYHDLGTRIAGRGLAPDATWLFFAVWASKTAGGVIRGDELPGWLREQVHDSAVAKQAAGGANRRWTLLRALGAVEKLGDDHLTKVVDEACEHVSGRIAAGNLLVFSELAPVFDALAADRQPNPPPGLARVVARYEAALAESDPDNRAVLVLEGNVMAVAHEQHRLQTYIASSMRPPLEASLNRVVDREVVHFIPGWIARRAAQGCIDLLRREMTRIWEEAATLFMMKLTTPDETLVLRDSVPPLPPGPAMFPPALAGAAAEAALHPWDLTHGKGQPSGADDWTLIRERMCYIVNLFRSRQRHPALTLPPFTAEQLEAMGSGRVPGGPL
jgi:hypothetical protein